MGIKGALGSFCCNLKCTLKIELTILPHIDMQARFSYDDCIIVIFF